MHHRTTPALFPLKADTNSFSNNDIDINDNTINTSSTHASNPQDNPHNPDLPPDNIHIPDTHPLRPRILATLWSWIIPGNPPRTHPPPDQPDNPITPQAQQNWHYQQPLESDTNNDHWGDPIPTPKPLNTFRILSKNVNTLSTKIEYLPWKAASTTISDTQADAITLQETNLSWNQSHQCTIQKILQHPSSQALIATASSSKISKTPHQPGGTLQAVVGDWATRVVQHGTDITGLGHWSYLEMHGKNDKCYIILSGYQVCTNQKFDLGSNNMYNQQFCILHQLGNTNPNPCNQFLEDIISLIKQWQASQKADLICIDANENINYSSRSNSINQIFQETDLVDLHRHEHQNTTKPATYNRGTKSIDLCAGSPEFRDAIIAAWYYPFGDPVGMHSTEPSESTST